MMIDTASNPSSSNKVLWKEISIKKVDTKQSGLDQIPIVDLYQNDIFVLNHVSKWIF